MEISYIITINPILELDYLDILIQSLNLQTNKAFNVIFYNQTRLDEKTLFNKLRTSAEFSYRFFSIESNYFFGEYPIWDLYTFHDFLIKEDIVSEYFMSLHMEEFLESEYTANILEVLKKHKFDILFGNLYNTDLSFKDFKEIESINTSKEFQDHLNNRIEKKATKWGLPTLQRIISKSPARTISNLKAYNLLNWKRQIAPTVDGFVNLKHYYLEDIYIMSTSFARRYHWFNPPIKLYFEDIHINRQLDYDMRKVTAFPVYFNKSKIYHLVHKKYYYQIENKEFADGLINFKTDNPILLAIKDAIQLKRSNSNMTTQKALQLTRRNSQNTGSANINVDFHKKVLLDHPNETRLN